MGKAFPEFAFAIEIVGGRPIPFLFAGFFVLSEMAH